MSRLKTPDTQPAQRRRDAMMDRIAGLGGTPVSAPILMSATLPLELSGEAVRPRLCVFPGQNGAELALRPDLTLPIAVLEVEQRQSRAISGAAVRHYAGPAFRLPSEAGDDVEFEQIGVEIFGRAGGIEDDVRVLETLAEALKAAGAGGLSLELGDLAIVPAFIDTLDLAEDTAASLKRAFRQAGGVEALLKPAAASKSTRFAERLAGLSRADAEAVVRETLAISGVSPIGTRSVDEVVTRLMAQGQGATFAEVPDGARSVFTDLLAVRTAPEAAGDVLSALAARHGLQGLDGVIEQMVARHAALPVASEAVFATAFGRRFAYYDGFAFDICLAGAKAIGAVAGGGRYDHLLGALSEGALEVDAVGGALRCDRLDRGLEALS